MSTEAAPAPGAETGPPPPSLPPNPDYRVAEPVTCGPLITDTCLPLDHGKLSLQAFWMVGLTAGRFSPNWRWVSPGGGFVSLAMPLKIMYGLAPRTEVCLIIPYVHIWARGGEYPRPAGKGVRGLRRPG